MGPFSLIPAGLEAALGIDIPTLALLAKDATPLEEIYAAAKGIAKARGIFGAFTGLFRKDYPTATRQEARQAYYAARYYADQGKYLAGIDPSLIIDRRLARVQQTASGKGARGEIYRYNVEILIHYPGEHDPSPKFQWVASDMLLSAEDAIELAKQGYFDRRNPGSKPMEYGGDLPDETITASLVDFTRFTV